MTEAMTVLYVAGAAAIGAYFGHRVASRNFRLRVNRSTLYWMRGTRSQRAQLRAQLLSEDAYSSLCWLIERENTQ